MFLFRNLYAKVPRVLPAAGSSTRYISSKPTVSTLSSAPKPSPPPKKIGIILYPGFQLLDICGPLDVLNLLSRQTPLNLCILASTLSPVTTQTPLSQSIGSHFAQEIVPTHTFSTAPDDLEVLIIPGGFGAREKENVADVVGFLESYAGRGGADGEEKEEGEVEEMGKWKEDGNGELRYVLTVCTGSAVLAMSSVLDGRRATSNKKAFAWVKEQNDKVDWIPKARWVVDRNLWTSSGVAAGIDMIYAWIGVIWGEETAQEIADISEYVRNKDPHNDPFAKRWGTE